MGNNGNWQPTLVFLPGEFCGQKSLVGCSPWSCKESDMTELLTHTCTNNNNDRVYIQRDTVIHFDLSQNTFFTAS